MTIAPYLREIGRGKDGARSLTREQSADLMARLLDGEVGDVEAGAFAIAMRIKGETPEELAGFMDAVAPRLLPLPAPDGGAGVGVGAGGGVGAGSPLCCPPTTAPESSRPSCLFWRCSWLAPACRCWCTGSRRIRGVLPR